MKQSLKCFDPEVFEIAVGDLARQQNCLTLIPSENYASRAVMQAQSTVLANKYAEGYPETRYYNGCHYSDQIEQLAIDRAKELFGADHVNVQPHSGSQANIAVFHALLSPGDTILSMKLDHGGHLSHGLPQNFSGKYYNIVHYGLDPETERINLETVADLADQHRPRLIIVGASAYPCQIGFAEWRKIADSVDAYLLGDVAHVAGLIVGKVHPDPVPYCDVVTTTTHKTLRGPRGAIILCRQELADSIDKSVFPGLQGGPFMHAIAARAVAFKEAAQPEFTSYQEQIISNARVMANRLMENGFRLVTGGTENHLMLIDLTSISAKLSGRQAANYLEEAGIIVNKNTIPFDTRSPNTTSGIRIGTPMVTTRGMKEDQMTQVADLITEVIQYRRQASKRQKIKTKVEELCQAFPIYEGIDQVLWS
ncbi:MAG: serine hydroxymethyltransferase [Candidatus Poribacteria bacterium]|nr:serine hydroxymethyltransferase [Candidatus Poribacteria bacterium]